MPGRAQSVGALPVGALPIDALPLDASPDTSPVTALTVLYDGHCGLCRRARDWLSEQPKLLPLLLLAAGSPAAVRRYPELDPHETLEELTVVSSAGGVYRGPRAWVMCLFALAEYREWSLRLGTPWALPLVRRGVELIGRLRRRAPCDGACGLPVRGARTRAPLARTSDRSSPRVDGVDALTEGAASEVPPGSLDPLGAEIEDAEERTLDGWCCAACEVTAPGGGILCPGCARLYHAACFRALGRCLDPACGARL